MSYVQYGCGMCAPETWSNFDASPTLRFERIPLIGWLYTKNHTRFPAAVRYGDIVQGLPVPPRSCRGVYCSHVLEHLSLAHLRVALQQTLAMLVPGGIFRLVVPDLEYLARQYLDDSTDFASSSFMRASGLGQERRVRGIRGMVVGSLGNAEHRWMWDYKSLARELANAGFVDVRRAAFGDCADPMFQAVEDQGRWQNCLGIECKNAVA
jgi:predicted SAM-dependent methyltransferase